MNMGEVQQKPENLAALQIEKEMVISQTDLKIRSCIICTGAREARIATTTQQGGSLSRQRTSEEEKGMLADKEKSRRPKVDRFKSHLHIVSCVDNDDNVSTGRNDGAFETLEDDKKSTLPL